MVHEVIRGPVAEFGELTRGRGVLITFVQEHVSVDGIVSIRDVSLQKNIVGFVVVSTNPCASGVDHCLGLRTDSYCNLLGSKTTLDTFFVEKESCLEYQFTPNCPHDDRTSVLVERDGSPMSVSLAYAHQGPPPIQARSAIGACPSARS